MLYRSSQVYGGYALYTLRLLDIMIRKVDGTPVSIIEAFRLESCGDKNLIVDSHLYKLLHCYDTVGHEKNYVLVYAEAKNFKDLWTKCLKYVQELNNKEGFVGGKCRLVSFEDTEQLFSKKADIRVGLAKHDREGYTVEVYHIFMNIYSDN